MHAFELYLDAHLYHGSFVFGGGKEGGGGGGGIIAHVLPASSDYSSTTVDN